MKSYRDLIVWHKRIFFSGLVILLCSCKQQKNQSVLLNKIADLNEFKIAQKRIDSLNNMGIASNISISILSNLSVFFYPEDSLKNLSYALIEEKNGFDERTLYIVKFDSLTNNIVEVISSE